MTGSMCAPWCEIGALAKLPLPEPPDIQQTSDEGSHIHLSSSEGTLGMRVAFGVCQIFGGKNRGGVGVKSVAR